ncbi:oxidoreductase, short chain dehydrogenase/reductase family protein [Cooperia oncophora]
MLSGKLAVVTVRKHQGSSAICSVGTARSKTRWLTCWVNNRCFRFESLEVARTISASADHTFFSCDVSKSQEVARLHEFVLKQNTKPPNIVVNCAGITKDSTLLKMSEKNFDDVVAVNLKGVFLITQIFAKSAVSENTPLSVINVSSIVGKVGNFGQCNYAATKAGVVAFGKTVGKELAKKGVRVNTVMPGFIRTPMTEAMPEKVLASICEGIPMGRMGEPEDIADATLFLASDMSKYMTGATLEVTGGLFM